MKFAIELQQLLPEIIVSLMACLILVVDQTRLNKFKDLPFLLTLLTLVLALYVDGNTGIRAQCRCFGRNVH